MTDLLDKDACSCRLIHQDRVDAAKQTALPEEENYRLAQLFKALGDPNRLKMIQALDHGEMCVCDLAAFLEVTESAASHQLRLLRQLNLVKNRRNGPILYYSLNDGHIRQLVHTALEHMRE